MKKFKQVLSKWQLLILLLPSLIIVIVFSYVPMYGLQIAFKDFSASKGIWGSEWIGLEHFANFFFTPTFKMIFENTIYLSFFLLLISFPIPIIFSLLLNSVPSQRFKSFVQTITYAPYFISTVVMVSMLNLFLAPESGFVNTIIQMFGFEPINFMVRAEWFRPVYIASAIWQTMGWSAIVYIAALTSVDVGMREAAVIDGASKFKIIRYIEIPTIMPTIVIMFILAVGNLMSIGYEKAYLMQQGMNMDASEIIATYVYKIGLVSAQYSYATAIGLFNSVVNLILILSTNYLSKKFSGTSLW